VTRAGAVAWALLAVTVAAMVGALVLWVVGVEQPFRPDIALFPAAFLAFGVVGALIVSRQPGNRIGALALATGVGGSLVAVSDSYAKFARPLPGQDWAAWVGAWGFPATLGPILFLILLFPTGRLASPRWRVVAAIVGIGIGLVTLGNMLSPVFADYPDRRNPLAVPALAGSLFDQGGVAWFLVLFGAIAAAIGIGRRLRRARGVEREQIKWVAFAGALNGIAWIVLSLDLPGIAGELALNALLGTFILVPVAAGIAILRYRLYDIDIVIRRTLVYGVLVGILGVVYVALVIGLQTVLSPVTRENTAAVAVSTLAIAALFGPVRARVREAVDRRFYRSRYDAERTIQAFAGRLRDQLELEGVGLALADAARQTVQPSNAGVWIRARRP
jgi:hypothetical protein